MTWLFKMKIETTAHAAADAMCNFSYMQRYFIKKSVHTFGVHRLLSFLISMSAWDKTVQLRISYSYGFFFTFCIFVQILQNEWQEIFVYILKIKNL